MRHFAQTIRLDGIVTASSTSFAFFFSIVGKTCIAKLGSTWPPEKLLVDRNKGHLAINPSTDLVPSVVSTTT